MVELIAPIGAPLIGLLVLAAVVAVGLRALGREGQGSPRMRRAMVTVGGGIVAVGLLGVLAEGCSGPASPDAGAVVSGH
jgi:hypothetical protein